MPKNKVHVVKGAGPESRIENMGNTEAGETGETSGEDGATSSNKTKGNSSRKSRDNSNNSAKASSSSSTDGNNKKQNGDGSAIGQTDQTNDATAATVAVAPEPKKITCGECGWKCLEKTSMVFALLGAVLLSFLIALCATLGTAGFMTAKFTAHFYSKLRKPRCDSGEWCGDMGDVLSATYTQSRQRLSRGVNSYSRWMEGCLGFWFTFPPPEDAEASGTAINSEEHRMVVPAATVDGETLQFMVTVRVEGLGRTSSVERGTTSGTGEEQTSTTGEGQTTSRTSKGETDKSGAMGETQGNQQKKNQTQRESSAGPADASRGSKHKAKSAGDKGKGVSLTGATGVVSDTVDEIESIASDEHSENGGSRPGTSNENNRAPDVAIDMGDSGDQAPTDPTSGAADNGDPVMRNKMAAVAVKVILYPSIALSVPVSLIIALCLIFGSPILRAYIFATTGGC